MTHVRLFKAAKTAMQSGRGQTKHWTMAFDETFSKETDPMMGWIQGAAPKDQLSLSFDSLDDAVFYVQQKHYTWEVTIPQDKVIAPKYYGDNFTNPRYRG